MQLVLSSSLGTARPLNVPFGSNRVASRRLSARSYHLRVRAEAEGAPEAASDDELLSESALKQAEADRLRAAEKFMKIGTGEAECKGCNYVYQPKNGDPEYPIAPGVKFENLPADWNCPVCGAEKSMFAIREREIAGFAENQGYGLGTNTMTGEQKSLLIFGSLAVFFLLFLLGYTLD